MRTFRLFSRESEVKQEPTIETPYKRFEVGGFVISVYYNESDLEGCRAVLASASGQWSLQIGGSVPAYACLLAMAEKDDKELLRGYALVNLLVSQLLLEGDTEFINTIVGAINAYQQAKDEDAQAAAAEVTPQQEMADTALMNEVIARGNLPKNKQRKAAKKARKEAKEVLSENGQTK